MKKPTAIAAAAALALCLGATTALTQEADLPWSQTGASKFTVTVPEPSYTIHIPTDVELTYGVTDPQALGTLSVSDVANADNYTIRCEILVDDLTNDTDPSIVIPTNVAIDNYTFHQDGRGSYSLAVWAVDYPSAVSSLTATVPSWASAIPGTYTGKLSFTFWLVSENS